MQHPLSLKRGLLCSISSLAILVAIPGVASAQAPQSPAREAPGSAATSGDRAQSAQAVTAQEILRDLEEAAQKVKAAEPAELRDNRQALLNMIAEFEERIQKPKGAAGSKAAGAGADATHRAELEKAISEVRTSLKRKDPNPQEVGAALERVVTHAREMPQFAQQQGSDKSGGMARSQQQDGDTSGKMAAGSPKGADIKVVEQGPKVQVQQPPPEVIVKQQPPRVVIQQAEPKVEIQTAKPNVRVTQDEPTVTVQKQGEPQVRIQESGQPRVTVQEPNEQADRDRADRQAQAQPGAADNERAERQPANPVATMGKRLVDKTLYGSRNENIGDVENVVMEGNQVSAVLVDVGGFLGLGSRRVSIPLDQLRWENNRLITAMTKDQVEALPEYRGR